MASLKFNLKPENELTVSAITLGLVYSIFGGMVPPYADIRSDKPGNANTHKAVKSAAITSTAVVASLGLLGRSKTVFIVGGAAILYETWKNHYANYGADGAKETAKAYAGGIA
jgi:hypothetical protein